MHVYVLCNNTIIGTSLNSLVFLWQSEIGTVCVLNLQQAGPSGSKTGDVAMETDIEIKQEPVEPRPQSEVITIDIDDDIILIDTDTTMKYLSGKCATWTKKRTCSHIIRRALKLL